MNIKKAVLATAICTGAGLSASVFAQAQLEEIIVTAQKRAEAINKVPLAITAVTGETIERQRIDELQQLRSIDPSLNYRQSTGPWSSSFLIRGVGTGSFSQGVEQSVSTVVDGVVLADPSSALDLTDLERVEILRGPQGMLFGKNASAGVVSITTRDPELDDFNGRVRVSLGSRKNNLVQGVLNLPISSTLALRVNGSSRHQQESVTNEAIGGRAVDPIDVRSVRAKLLWKPNDDFRAVLSANYSKSENFCCAPVWINDIPGYIVDYSNNLHGVVPGENNTEAAFDFHPTGGAEVYGSSLSIDYDIGEYTLTSVTGFQESDRKGLFDADQHAFNYLSLGGQELNYRNFTEELRIASPTGGTFDYVAGLYYYEAKLEQTGYLGGYFQSMFPPLTMPTPQVTRYSLVNFTSNKYESSAVFAQGNLHITDQLTLVVGGRYTYDDVSLLLDDSAEPGTTPFRAPRIYRTSVDNDNFSWRIGPQFELTPEIMLYATYARGYKGPGTSPTEGVLIEPEIPTTYEVGAKGTAFDRQLQFSVNAFHSEFKDFQAQVFDPNILATVLKNAGKLESQGIEFQLLGAVTPELTLGFNGAYIDAEYKDFAGVACYFGQPEPPCAPPFAGSSARVFNAAGLRLNGSPKWSYSATMDYRLPDLIQDFEVFASANWSWQDDVVYSANGDPGTRQEAFGMLGGEIGIEPEDGAWRLSLWAKNILDERWFSQIGAAPIQSNNPGGYSGYRSPDAFRRVGVQFELNF